MTAVALALATGSQHSAFAQASGSALDPGVEYTHPHQLVDVDHGRKINLYCIGSGSATVLFDSGLSDWSSIWALVQPSAAARVRACSYDRAGMGYSDPAEGPRTPIAIVEDMHKLVHRAGLTAPLVLVGHSLGGFNVKLYATLYPADVSGVVLVDPAEDRIADRTRSLLQQRYGKALAARAELLDHSDLLGAVAHFESCAASAREHDLDPASDVYRGCTDPVRTPLGPAIAAERARLQVGRVYQEAQASEIANSVYADPSGDRAYAMLFRPGALGDKPLIVLTHSIYDQKDPLEAAGFTGWNAVHDETARLSRRGRNRIVPNTHHNIEVDDPQAIVDAIFEVIAQLGQPRRKR
jgi:pimeloyl-ACP methyl ester carboxylesterase